MRGRIDTELLLGEAISPDRLNDDAVGHALDRVYEVGTSKVLSAVAVRVVKLFELDTTHVHHDTTSRTFYGDYDLYGEGTHDQPFTITFGFSKDHPVHESRTMGLPRCATEKCVPKPGPRPLFNREPHHPSGFVHDKASIPLADTDNGSKLSDDAWKMARNVRNAPPKSPKSKDVKPDREPPCHSLKTP